MYVINSRPHLLHKRQALPAPLPVHADLTGSSPTPMAQEDEVEPREKLRTDTNKALRKMCGAEGCFFISSGKKFFKKNGKANLDLWADDGLHLGDTGIITLGNFFQGNVAALLDKNKKVNPKKKPKTPAEDAPN